MLSALSLDTRFTGTAEALAIDPLALQLQLAPSKSAKGPISLEVSTRADLDLGKGTALQAGTSHETSYPLSPHTRSPSAQLGVDLASVPVVVAALV